MVKAYLRYEPAASFGVVTSTNCNVLFDTSGKLLISAALENTIVWNAKQGAAIQTLRVGATSDGSVSTGSRAAEVTALARPGKGSQIAAGYADGTIRLWNIDEGSCDVVFSGHKGAVSCLRYSADGSLLASGGNDTDIVVWDVAAETGLYRLRAHKDQVTDLVFVKGNAFLVSSSKDTQLRVWELALQHCVQVVVGHRGEIWSLDRDPEGRRLITGSSDGELRLYKILSGQEPATVAGGAVPDATTGATPGGGKNKRKHAVDHPGTADDGGDLAAVTGDRIMLEAVGSIKLQSKERVVTLRYNDSGSLLGCQVAGKSLEVFRVHDDVAALRRAKRRWKRKKEKAAHKGAVGGGDADASSRHALHDGSSKHHASAEELAGAAGMVAGGGVTEDNNENVILATDEISPFHVLRLPHKIHSFAFGPGAPHGQRGGGSGGGQSNAGGAVATLGLATHNNTLQVYELRGSLDGGGDDAPADAVHSHSIEHPGHRSDIRALALSSDDSLLLSLSHNAAKIWNPRTSACLRTLDSGYGLCGLFVPGNRQVVVGTKTGQLQLFDVGGAALLESLDGAHDGAVWALAGLPGTKGFVSGSADKTVKFWEYAMVEVEPEGGGEAGVSEEGKKGKKGKSGKGGDANGEVNGDGKNEAPRPQRLSLVNAKTMTMTDDVLCVRVSPDGRHLAVSLLDSTIKIFFVDSLKFFLSLYGHKLPVLGMDISSDGTLLASGSADKTLKIWGLDFGDCHRSLFAHSDSVMAVAFVKNTHYLFTAGKDKTVKYWDADKFEELLVLDGHHSEVWCLAVSRLGDFVVSGSHDRSLRRWQRTEEPFFVEEEQEKRLESLFEAGLGDGEGAAGAGDAGVAGKGVAAEGIVSVARRTQESVNAADALADALEMAALESERLEAEASKLREKEGGAKEGKKKGGAKGKGDLLTGGKKKGDSSGVLGKETGGGDEEDEEGGVDGERAGDKDKAKAPAIAPNPLMMGLGPSAYILSKLVAVRSSDLEQALLLLPFTSALTLLTYLCGWLEAGGVDAGAGRLQRQQQHLELLARVAVLLLRLHQRQLSATPAARPTLVRLHASLRPALQGLKDCVGYNLAAVAHVQGALAARGNMRLFEDADDKVREVRRQLAEVGALGDAERQAQKRRKRQKEGKEKRKAEAEAAGKIKGKGKEKAK